MISQDAVQLTLSVQNKEQYLTFSVPIKKNTKNDKNGKETTKNNDLQIKIH